MFLKENPFLTTETAGRRPNVDSNQAKEEKKKKRINNGKKSQTLRIDVPHTLLIRPTSRAGAVLIGRLAPVPCTMVSIRLSTSSAGALTTNRTGILATYGTCVVTTI